MASVVGILAGATALFDWFGGKVDPPPPPPPAEVDARISSVELRSRSQSLVAYLREIGESTRGLSTYEGAENGYVFVVKVRIKGNLDQRIPLRWSIVDTRTDTPLAGDTYNQTAVVFKPRALNQRRTWPIWVPYPDRPGQYRLRATLVDAKRAPLDEADSRAFRVRRAPRL